jgi:hypothetical protein
VNQALWILALLSLQADDTVRRNDPNRSAYQEAFDACHEAERLLTASPEAALEKLAPVFADGIDRARFALIERRLFIEAKSQEFTPHDFFPYHLRGRARLLVARKKKEEDARRLLIDAAVDLQGSLTRGATRSKEPLSEAQKELWDNVRAALAYEGWKPGRAALADQALALLSTGDLGPLVAAWLGAELARLETSLRELRKQQGDPEARRPAARQAAGWCEAVAAAVRGTVAYQEVLNSAARTLALAAAIRDSRGQFRLKIGVSPWARVTRFEREGEEIPLADRDTPLRVPQELDIGDYTIELSHPNGRKIARILAKSLEPGRTYVLWGDMNGDQFEVSELAK